MRCAIPLIVLLVILGCDDTTPHPNQQAVDRAEKLTNQALAQAQAAERELQHERRLRDIDAMNHQAEVEHAETELLTWRACLVGLSAVVVITLLWLAREVRTRRILAHVLRVCSGRREEEARE